MEYKLINEETIMIYFEQQIDPSTFKEVQKVEKYIKDQQHEAIIEVIPSYRAIMLHIDITKQSLAKVVNELKLEQLNKLDFDENLNKVKTISLPVLYGGNYGPDIQEVATHNQLSIEEVIKLHTENTYLIYMLGFMPGFPFLGGLNSKLATPRREEPRTSIPAGSVGIANNQTGLYPKQSPGGWQIIGRTPITVFDILRTPMCLYESGDYIKFYSIDESTFEQIVEAQQGEFDIEKWVKIQYEY
ncbi:MULTISPECIES: 5-oxoprolinase subunit PxpB [Staphylococcus]|uniref:Allophanate hydrolase n=1 Tax=Staphylococcus cohnii TaxID=29382 RepID=A0A2T4LP92_9STAP|nr:MULTISPECIES: 5-oxoprolinase subunit PxpB [Staphylococcus]MBB2508031.1 Kinase A inhibitor [Staphylococcus cohnii subsp. barensis]MCE5034397.1 5-oxoprolinase subunit PxpB [Staphylococcus cohnii]MCE5098869.1 5-oxoprolinase subunit PxpB [Staphylococcus cohnii]MSU28797.1 5-oxoprolinase subunit PxpB [Staphylococcus sp. McC-251-APC-3A2]PTF05303.1 allophanate hydrolase [Staphylococcus cohnii]